MTKKELIELKKYEDVFFNNTCNSYNGVEIHKMGLEVAQILQNNPSDVNCINYISKLKMYIVNMFNELGSIINDQYVSQIYKEYKFVILNNNYDRILTLCSRINGKISFQKDEHYVNALEILNPVNKSDYDYILKFINQLSTRIYQSKNIYKPFDEEKENFFRLKSEINLETDVVKRKRLEDQLKVTIGNLGEYYALEEMNLDNSLRNVIHVAKDIGNDEHYDIYGVISGENLPAVIEVKTTTSKSNDFNNDVFSISMYEFIKMYKLKYYFNVDCFIYRVFIDYDENTKRLSFKTRILHFDKLSTIVDTSDHTIYYLAQSIDGGINYICGNENNTKYTRVKYIINNQTV